MKSATIKTVGYLISTVSVLLLGVVSWKAASHEPVLKMCLIGGMSTSILGMLMRWISYQRDEKGGGSG
jgi:uncharacterized protein involved in response to NO